MNYQQAKREMDAAEERLTHLGTNCTVATLPDYRRARREFDRAASVAHDALWEEIRSNQEHERVSPCAS